MSGVSRPGRLRLAYSAARGSLAAFGLLFAVITFTPALRPWITFLSRDWTDAKGQTLIVLAGDAVDRTLIGQGSYWRSVYAVRAWREGGFQAILISGAPASVPMRDFIVANGVPASAVQVEPQSTSTRTNALFTQRLLGADPVPLVLLTSDYHMFRALRAFRKAGLNVQPRPIPDASKRMSRLEMRWSVFLDLGVETVKIMVYRLRGWI